MGSCRPWAGRGGRPPRHPGRAAPDRQAPWWRWSRALVPGAGLGRWSGTPGGRWPCVRRRWQRRRFWPRRRSSMTHSGIRWPRWALAALCSAAWSPLVAASRCGVVGLGMFGLGMGGRVCCRAKPARPSRRERRSRKALGRQPGVAAIRDWAAAVGPCPAAHPVRPGVGSAAPVPPPAGPGDGPMSGGRKAGASPAALPLRPRRATPGGPSPPRPGSAGLMPPGACAIGSIRRATRILVACAARPCRPDAVGSSLIRSASHNGLRIRAHGNPRSSPAQGA
jgi:hypothetical protein